MDPECSGVGAAAAIDDGAASRCATGGERDGGAFVDMDDETAPGKTIEPKFNRLVVFKVPRVHAVAPVTSENRRRHAIFGWFYRPAREDELPSSDADDASDASDASESRARKRKRARRERGE